MLCPYRLRQSLAVPLAPTPPAAVRGSGSAAGARRARRPAATTGARATAPEPGIPAARRPVKAASGLAPLRRRPLDPAAILTPRRPRFRRAPLLGHEAAIAGLR